MALSYYSPSGISELHKTKSIPNVSFTLPITCQICLGKVLFFSYFSNSYLLFIKRSKNQRFALIYTHFVHYVLTYGLKTVKRVQHVVYQLTKTTHVVKYLVALIQMKIN
jgi:hypothetical protein